VILLKIFHLLFFSNHGNSLFYVEKMYIRLFVCGPNIMILFRDGYFVSGAEGQAVMCHSFNGST
jgi:ABC-type uncharacterized transport system permease subunit